MPPHPSDAEPRPPADFAPLLATKEPLLLVGGQAVNLWALFYKDQTTDLAPFVSRDADILGDRETLETLGKMAGAKPQFFPLKPPSNEIGVIIAKDAHGSPMLIEVLRQVHGATNDELREPAYTLAIGENQVLVQVPGPIALLQAKIANFSDLNQTGRQDGRHVLILARLMPAYLKDLCQSAAESRMTERKLIDFMERLLAVIISPASRKAFRDLKVDARSLFPGLSPNDLPKLSAFLRKRLTRALGS